VPKTHESSKDISYNLHRGSNNVKMQRHNRNIKDLTISSTTILNREGKGNNQVLTTYLK